MTQGNSSLQSKIEYSINILVQDELYIVFLFIRANPCAYGFAQHKSVVNPQKYYVILLVFGNCVPEGLKGQKDTPFWLLGSFSTPPSDADVPPISNPGNGGGGTAGSGRPIRGMYFLHPDHLGSVRMITDANGRIAAIGDAGASNIRYKPYGEVNRGNSYGPDIFRYKYTAQQEDIESGLYYYKSRYYDPNIGQFMQADSVIGLNTPLGTNQYAYTEGNPVRFTDPSGYMSYSSMMNRITKDLTKAAIMEVSQQSDLMAATTRMYMTHINIQKEKKIKSASSTQLIKSGFQVLLGAIIILVNPGAALFGWSLITSGLAGFGGYYAGGMAKGYWDEHNALQGSKLAAGIAGIAMFIYSFVNNDAVRSIYDAAVEANEHLDEIKDAAEGFTYWQLINRGINEFIIWAMEPQFLKWLPTEIPVPFVGNLKIPYSELWDYTLHYGKNGDFFFPGRFSYLMFFGSVDDVTYYHRAIWRTRIANPGNVRYYYREMIRKKLYYQPYVCDFINSEGVFAQ